MFAKGFEVSYEAIPFWLHVQFFNPLFLVILFLFGLGHFVVFKPINDNCFKCYIYYRKHLLTAGGFNCCLKSGFCFIRR